MFIRLILEKPAIIGIPVLIGIIGSVAEGIKADRIGKFSVGGRTDRGERRLRAQPDDMTARVAGKGAIG